MALLPALYKKNLIFLTLIGAVILIGNVAASLTKENKDNDSALLNNTHTEKQQKTFKKDLKINLTAIDIEQVTLPPESIDHTEKLIIIDEKSVIETVNIAGEHQTPATQSATVLKEHHHEKEKFLIKGDANISDSLKTGFYFFLIISSGALIFITIKIYRLRLSRAERKYGVHGDRTNQELTPLPISIEDGHSDDEDQTLFEVQRQNIRIL